MANRPSSIDKLPDEVRDRIAQLRGSGWTIDQILEHLATLLDQVPSRSALGRHIVGLDKLGERIRRSRDVASALAREFGDAPGSKAAQVNIELLHSAVLELFSKAGDGEEVNAAGTAALAGDPQGVMLLAKALDHLAKASKTNVDFVAAAEARATARARAEAATSAEAVAREKGLSADTVSAIKAAIFGVKP
jgi:hypothetical protein